MRVDPRRRVNPSLRVTVKRIKQRVAVRIVIRRQLRFDVGQRNVAPDANISSLANVWEIHVQIHHHRIEAILFSRRMPQQLLAEIPLCRGETVVQSPQSGKTEPPIKMVGLHRIRLAFNVEHFLIGFDRVRHFVVSRGKVVILPCRWIHSTLRCAKVSADIQPAVNLYLALLPKVAVRPFPKSRHQWPGLRPGLPNRHCAPSRPRGKRKRWSIHWRWISAERWCRRGCCRNRCQRLPVIGVGPEKSPEKAALIRSHVEPRASGIGGRRVARRLFGSRLSASRRTEKCNRTQECKRTKSLGEDQSDLSFQIASQPSTGKA